MSDPTEKKKARKRFIRDQSHKFNDKRKKLPKIDSILNTKIESIHNSYFEDKSFLLEVEEVREDVEKETMAQGFLNTYHDNQTIVRDVILHSAIFRPVIKDMYKSIEGLASYVVSNLYEQYFSVLNQELPVDIKNDDESIDVFNSFLNKVIDFHSKQSFGFNTEMLDIEKRLNTCADIYDSLGKLVELYNNDVVVSELVNVVKDNIYNRIVDGFYQLNGAAKTDLPNIYPELKLLFID